MSIFTCCERGDETKYLHPCGCPSAIVSCESEGINATLCGFSEFDGYESSPPKKYRSRTNTGSGQTIRKITATGETYATTNIAISGTRTYDDLCVVSGNYTFTKSYTSTADGLLCSSTSTTYNTEGIESTTSVIIGTTETCTTLFTCANPTSTVSATSYQKGGGCGENRSGSWSVQLGTEDTEEDAIERETPEAGTSCSSLWETRSTGFSFTIRTSGYTIECSGLIVGLEYEVHPLIRKRTAVIGSYGEWEDVTVISTSFTATATTETIDQSGNPIELDHVQGYEYEITGVNIEKKA